MYQRVFLVGFTGGIFGGSLTSFGGFYYLGKHHHKIFKNLYQRVKNEDSVQ